MTASFFSECRINSEYFASECGGRQRDVRAYFTMLIGYFNGILKLLISENKRSMNPIYGLSMTMTSS